MSRAVCSFLALVLTGSAALGQEQGIDYRKVDRSITREPDYESDRPLYALMLFGPEAAFRVWLVFDGQAVYLDRNGDGDLTSPDERFNTARECRNVELRPPAGSARYFIEAVSELEIVEPAKRVAYVDIEIRGRVEYRQYAGVQPGEDPAAANVAHFDGPLTAGPIQVNGKLLASMKLRTGDKSTELQAMVGTIDPESGCWVAVKSQNGKKYAFDEGVVPVIDIEFPGKTPHAPVLRKRYRLFGFC